MLVIGLKQKYFSLTSISKRSGLKILFTNPYSFRIGILEAKKARSYYIHKKREIEAITKLMRKITLYLLIITAIFALNACKKSDTPTPTPTPVTLVETIYTVGYERSPNGVGHYVAKYWKDTTAVNLTDGSTETEARSIAVVGNDVYV